MRISRVSVEVPWDTMTDKSFDLSRAWDKEKSESPGVMESSRAPMLTMLQLNHRLYGGQGNCKIHIYDTRRAYL